MARVQLNLKMPAELVARLREEAAGRGITLTSLVEERLGGASSSASSSASSPAPPATPELADRLAGIEERLAALEAGPSPRPLRRSMPVEGEELLDPIEAGAGGERVTTGELAELLGISRRGLNNWIARNPSEAERDGWRRAGRVRPPGGGPSQWLWERTETQDKRRNGL